MRCSPNCSPKTVFQLYEDVAKIQQNNFLHSDMWKIVYFCCCFFAAMAKACHDVIMIYRTVSFPMTSVTPNPCFNVNTSWYFSTAKARGLQGQGHKILSSWCLRGRGQSSRTPSLRISKTMHFRDKVTIGRQ